MKLVCLNYSYAQDVDKKAAQEETKEEKPARQVRDRKDALQIAKDYLGEEDMQSDYHSVGHMTKPLVKLKGDIWHVVLLKKRKDNRTVKTESIRIIIPAFTDQGTRRSCTERENDFRYRY